MKLLPSVGIKLIVLAVVLSLAFQIFQLYRFVYAGKRFTAHDGQVLCERVRALEERSYGFRDSGKKPLDCQYEGEHAD